MPRILEVRGVIVSNCVSEFRSKLKAFMSDSKWKTQPGASSSWKFLSSQTMGHSLTFDWGEQSEYLLSMGPVWYE